MGGTLVRVTLGITDKSLEMQMRGDSDHIQGSPAENPWRMGHVGLGGTLRGIPIATGLSTSTLLKYLLVPTFI